MEIHLLMTYLAAITLLTITPGVDTMLIIRNAARGGWQDGFVTSFGICSGLFVHAAISAVGISVILLQTAWLFSALKLLGAGYLVWLGISNWRGVLGGTSMLCDCSMAVVGGAFDAKRSLREGLLSNVLNPKAVIFYMAFLPHFINPEGSALLQSLLLAGCHFLIAMVWQCVLSVTVNRARVWLQKPGFNKIFGGATGSVMVLLGLRLALED